MFELILFEIKAKYYKKSTFVVPIGGTNKSFKIILFQKPASFNEMRVYATNLFTSEFVYPAKSTLVGQ